MNGNSDGYTTLFMLVNLIKGQYSIIPSLHVKLWERIESKIKRQFKIRERLKQYQQSKTDLALCMTFSSKRETD